jgi:transcriptional regulator with XRE-family HTH domain
MPRTPNQLVAANLKRFRAKKEWSQEELADRCGLHRTYIGAIERGERNITLNTLFDISTALGISPAELISEPRDGKAV